MGQSWKQQFLLLAVVAFVGEGAHEFDHPQKCFHVHKLPSL
jgi:hypothetical protein